MARDIEPAKRGDLIGHFVGERFECVTPLVRHLEGARQIPPVESGRALQDKPDTDRIDNAPPHQETEVSARPEAPRRATQKQPQAEAAKRATQKTPAIQPPERATKPVEATSSERLTKPVTGGVPFPDRPTDSVFMDPVVMADDSFFDDANFAADAPTINEPLPVLGKAEGPAKPPTAKVPAAPAAKVPTGKVPAAPPRTPTRRVAASAAPVVPSPADTVFEAKPLEAAPTLDNQEMSIDTELPSFNDEPAVEEDTSLVRKQQATERPTTKVEPRTDVKPTTGRRPGEVVRDTVNFYNQTSSLKDIIEQVMAEEPPVIKGMLPKDPLKPANVAPPSDFLNSDNLPASLMDDEEETDMSPTQSDDRRLGTERLPAAASADGLAPTADDSFDNVGNSSLETVFDFNDTGAEVPAAPVSKAAPKAPTNKVPAKPAVSPVERPPKVPTAKVRPPEPELPMPEAVGGDFLSNDEFPSAAGDRITPEFLATPEVAAAPPAAPAPPPAVPLSRAAMSPTLHQMEAEAMALNGRTVALPPPPDRKSTAKTTPPTRVPTAPVAQRAPSDRQQAVPAPTASAKPLTGKVPPAVKPLTGKVPPAPATLPEAKTEIGLPTAARVPAPASAAKRPDVGQREALRPTHAGDLAAKATAPVVPAARTPTAKQAPVPGKAEGPTPPAKPSTKLPVPSKAEGPVPSAEQPQEALVGGGGSGETTVIVEPRQMMPTTNAVAQSAKPPAVTVSPTKPEPASASLTGAAAEAAASTTIFDVPLQKLEAAKAAGRVPTTRVAQIKPDAVAATPGKVEAPKPARVPAVVAAKMDEVSRRLKQDRLDTRKLIESAEAVLAKLKGLKFTPPRRIAREETGRRASTLLSTGAAVSASAPAAKAEAPLSVGASQPGAQARLGGSEAADAPISGGPDFRSNSYDAGGGAGTIEQRDLRGYRPPTERVSFDELLLGQAPDSGLPPRDSAAHSRRETVRREAVPREPATRKNDKPYDDMDIDTLLAAASVRPESESARRAAVGPVLSGPEGPPPAYQSEPVDEPPPRPEQPRAPQSPKMTSVLAKELDGMLRQMAADSARLPQEPVQDKIAPRSVGISFLDGPLWQTLLGLAGMSAFLTALFILIWFFLIKG
ncbi:MAG: hypothetical protein IT462_01690 [Planctomycetes bacterium]|nr:hypothetical protein [Planctomycetota bacterium]